MTSSSVPLKRAYDQTKSGVSTSDISTSSASKKSATSATATNVTAPSFPTFQQQPRKTFTVDASTSKQSIANASKVDEKKVDASESLKKAVEIALAVEKPPTAQAIDVAATQTIELEFADLKARQNSFIEHSKKTISLKKEAFSREKTALSVTLNTIDSTIEQKTALLQQFDKVEGDFRNQLESAREEAKKAAVFMAEIQEKLDIATKRFNEANVAKNTAESKFAKYDLAADQAKSCINGQQEERLKVEETLRVLQERHEESIRSIGEKIQALGGTLD